MSLNGVELYIVVIYKKKEIVSNKNIFFVKCRLSSSATKLKTFGQRHFIDKARRVQMASNNVEGRIIYEYFKF